MKKLTLCLFASSLLLLYYFYSYPSPTSGIRLAQANITTDASSAKIYNTTHLPKATPLTKSGIIVPILYGLQTTAFEIPLSPQQNYYVLFESIPQNASNKYILKIYKDEKLLFEEQLYGGGEAYLVDTRGNGCLDIVVALSGGTFGSLNTFLIVGQTEHGIAKIADGRSVFGSTRNICWTKITEFSNLIGFEYTPIGGWVRYRMNLTWDAKQNTYVRSNFWRITPPAVIPPHNREVFFGLNKKPFVIKYFDFNGHSVEQITIKKGESLLLRRANKDDEEVDIAGSGYRDYDNKVIDLEFCDGHFLVTALAPGKTTISLWVDYYPTTKKAITIIVEP